MQRYLRGRKGSITIEASILIPVVILCILALIYISLILYQQARMRAVANEAAERGVKAWCNPAGGMAGIVDSEALKGQKLYWRWIDGQASEKTHMIEEYVLSRLQEEAFLPVTNTRVDVAMTGGLLYKKLTVCIERTFYLPGAKFLKIFGLKNEYTVKAVSEAVVSEPVELIRNTDFAVNIEKELEEKYPQLRTVREKMGEILSGIKDQVDRLFRD